MMSAALQAKVASACDLLQFHRDFVRNLENRLQGTGITPQQVFQFSQSVGTVPRGVPGHMDLVVQLLTAEEQLQQAQGQGIESLRSVRDQLIGTYGVLRPLIDAMGQPQPDRAAASTQSQLSPQDLQRFESVFGRLLTAAQEPSAATRYDDGVQQVKVAIMDSGSGGLVAGKTIEQVLDPNGDGKITFAYVTDHGANTYGNRPPEDIARLTNRALRYAQDVLHADLIIMACNTATASFPLGGRDGITIPVVDLIENTANIMLREGGEHPAMFATAAMSGVQPGDPRASDPDPSRSNGYKTALARHGVELVSVPCPKWANFVNEGYHNDTENPERIAEVAADVRTQVAKLPLNTTAVFLNCTHYPALEEMIASAISQRWDSEAPNVTQPRVIDPMREQARSALQQIQAIRERGTATGGAPTQRVVVTTGNPSTVARQVYTNFRGPTVVFGMNPTFQVPVFKPSSSAFPPPYEGVPQAIIDGHPKVTAPDLIPDVSTTGFTFEPRNLSRLPGDVTDGMFDLNYLPRGPVDDRLYHLRQEAYQIVNMLRPDVRASARRQIDAQFEQRSRELAGMPSFKMPGDASPVEARAVGQALLTFATASVASPNLNDLPPAPRIESARIAVRSALMSAGQTPAQADAFLAKIDLELTSWIDDLNVQRNDLVHRLAEAIANLLAPLPRR